MGSAAVLATAVLGALIARRRPGGPAPRWPALLLALQAAVLWQITVLAVAAALRTRSLLGEAPEARSATLLALSANDGDAHLYSVMAVLVLVVVGLPAAVVTLAARAAGGSAHRDRWIGAVTLGAQVVAGVVAAIVAVVEDERSWPLTALMINAVPSVLGAWGAWPARRSPVERLRDSDGASIDPAPG